MSSPTGRNPNDPVFQHLPPRTKLAKEIVEAFRKSHQPEIDCLDIDYATLELLVAADLLNKEDKEKP